MTELLTLALFLAALGLAWISPRLRALSPTRRVFAIAAAAVIGVVAFRPLRPQLGAALAGERPLGAPEAMIVTVAALAAVFAFGLVLRAIYDDSNRTSSRLAVLGLGSLAVALGLCSVSLLPWIALPLALRTGWARRLGRHWATIVASLTGIAALLVWPGLPATGGCWPPVCHHGLALARFTHAFLGVQLGIISIRLIFGVMFGPRRIGRRLLVSHLLIGVLPVGLTGLFVVIVALLALANLRASTAAHLLRTQHEMSERLLPGLAADVLASGRFPVDVLASGPLVTDTPAHDSTARALPNGDPGLGQASEAEERPSSPRARATAAPGGLDALAARLAVRWQGAARWCPVPEAAADGSGTTDPCLLVAVAVAAADGDVFERAAIYDVDAASAAGGDLPTVVRGVLARASEGAALDRQGRQRRIAQVPSPFAWARRPNPPGGFGLIKSAGRTYHVTDSRLRYADRELRIQLIEELATGRVRILDDFFHGAARIHERLRLSAADTTDVGGQVAVTTDTLAAERADGEHLSSYNSGYEVAPAQEWSPQRGWEELRLSVLGLSEPLDLIPDLPRVRENPLSLLPVVILASTTLLFILVETAALVSVVRTGRAIGVAVGLLRQGTERLERGDFAYRIPARGQDELADLARSFNDMAQGLEDGQRHALARERLESELELARRIQQRLLPTHPPELPGCRLAGISLPARQVGGDYYDFIRLPDGKILFVMADVSGKGVPAALLMSSVRAALHSMPTGSERPAEIVARLNGFVHASTSTSEFVTAFIGFLDGTSGKLSFVNAGHDPPFVIKPDGTLERLEEGGILLGAFAGAEYKDSTAALQPGDTLFLYTDGLSEALDPAGEMFGLARIEERLRAVAGQSPQQVLSAALQAVEEFARGAEASDDITLLAIQRAAPGSERKAPALDG